MSLGLDSLIKALGGQGENELVIYCRIIIHYCWQVQGGEHVICIYMTALEPVWLGVVILILRKKTSANWWKYDFHGENFRGLLAFAVPKDVTPHISPRKLSHIATKPQNLQKFSPSKVFCYTISESQWTLWLGNAKVKTWPGVYLVLLWMFFTVVLLYLLVEGWLQRSSCLFTQEVQLCIQGYLLLCKYFLLNQTENHPQHCMHLHFLKTVHSFCVISCPVLLLITIIGNITTIR